MYELTLIRQNGGNYIDSREVAEVIGKRHHHLLRDINRYIKVMEESIETNFGFNDFFLESNYMDSIGRELPCYLLSKMGCEMVANKLTGEKGVLFTAAYVSKFNEMEQRERADLEALIEMSQRPEPRLGEINAYVRIIVRGLKDFGATPERIMEFLKETYEPLGFTVAIDAPDESALHWHTAGEIAERCEIYSLNNKPHRQAVSCILNENLFISEEHKRIVTENYGSFTSVSVRYDDFAMCEVMKWIVDNELPDEVYGFGRTYHIQYPF